MKLPFSENEKIVQCKQKLEKKYMKIKQENREKSRKPKAEF